MDTKQILNQLGIDDINYGACAGPNDWYKTTDSGKLDSINPSNGDLVASVYQCSKEDYNSVVENHLGTFIFLLNSETDFHPAL